MYVWVVVFTVGILEWAQFSTSTWFGVEQYHIAAGTDNQYLFILDFGSHLRPVYLYLYGWWNIQSLPGGTKRGILTSPCLILFVKGS
jgi:hypothetical protein